jgi:hypothetical protein
MQYYLSCLLIYCSVSGTAIHSLVLNMGIVKEGQITHQTFESRTAPILGVYRIPYPSLAQQPMPKIIIESFATPCLSARLRSR